jgi:hypothetical protein
VEEVEEDRICQIRPWRLAGEEERIEKVGGATF